MAEDEDDTNSVTSSPSPPNLSFRVLESTGRSSRFQFSRSISHKESTTSDFPTAAEVVDLPRLSFSHVQNHLASPVDSYPTTSTAATQKLGNGFNGGCSYRFISSVLKKDGQVIVCFLLQRYRPCFWATHPDTDSCHVTRLLGWQKNIYIKLRLLLIKLIFKYIFFGKFK